MHQIILAGLMASMNKDWMFSMYDHQIPVNLRDTKSKRKRSRYQVRGW